MSLLSLATSGRASSTQAAVLADEGDVGRHGHGLGRTVAPLDAEVHVDPVGPGERVGEARRGGHAGHRVGRLAEHIDGVGHAVLGDLDAEIGHARERVVPGVSLEARVALEQALRAGDSRPLGGAPESLLVLRLGIDGHDQRAGAYGRV